MVKKNALIVVGLGYGDEGKGLTTDYLCLNNTKSLVIRYNGGHQAGHCVTTKDGKKHVFSNFGSGSFRNIPTYWSSYCTFEPTSFIKELHQLNFEPKIYIDKNCPITTHYDVLYNRAIETTKGIKRDGSCGVGFGATVNRQKTSKVALFFRDILKIEVLQQKLKDIREYYRTKMNLETAFVFDSFSHEEEDLLYINSVNKLYNLISRNIIVPIFEKEVFSENMGWNTFIFEGAQGILLDQNFGIKPHITKSNTTSKNALNIIARQTGINFVIEIIYVTRAYQTRHGAGPFRPKSQHFVLRNNEGETNLMNEYQGEFRTNYLDIDMLNYALICDNTLSKGITKNLFITCLDHFNSEEIIVFKNHKKVKINYRELANELLFDLKDVKYSFSNCAEFLI